MWHWFKNFTFKIGAIYLILHVLLVLFDDIWVSFINLSLLVVTNEAGRNGLSLLLLSPAQLLEWNTTAVQAAEDESGVAEEEKEEEEGGRRRKKSGNRSGRKRKRRKRSRMNWMRMRMRRIGWAFLSVRRATFLYSLYCAILNEVERSQWSR
jgi:hypothetical protein